MVLITNLVGKVTHQDAFGFYAKGVLMSNFTDRICNQHHQIEQKKFIQLILWNVDPYLTLPLV